MNSTDAQWLLLDVPSSTIESGRDLLARNGIIEDGDVPDLWWARRSAYNAMGYRVQAIRMPDNKWRLICSCPHGQYRAQDSYCKHRAAVLLLVSGRTEGVR